MKKIFKIALLVITVTGSAFSFASCCDDEMAKPEDAVKSVTPEENPSTKKSIEETVNYEEIDELK